MNLVILCGWLGQDPEVRYGSNGQAVCTFSVCTGRKFENREGKEIDDTAWHKCIAFGKTGETAGQYLAKGKRVLIHGSNRTNEWTTKDGEKRKDRQVRVDILELIEPKSDSQRSNNPPANKQSSHQPPANSQNYKHTEVEHDLPF